MAFLVASAAVVLDATITGAVVRQALRAGNESLEVEIFGRHFGDALSDRERRGCAWRRSVEDVDGAGALPDDKVVYERAVARNGLSAHAGSAGNQVALTNFR